MAQLYRPRSGAAAQLKGAANLEAMPNTEEISALIEAALPGSMVNVEDWGGGDHLYAHVSASQFAGLSLIEQHRLVNDAVAHLLGPGKPIHALKIKTEVVQ
jgi:stress-induced morphogen